MVIASGVIDRGHLSPFGGPPADSSSSFFSEDLVVSPPERQVGFWKSESMVADQRGSKSIFASPLEKMHPMGADPEGSLERPGGQGFKGLDILRVGKLMGQGNGLPWGDMITTPGSRLGSSARETATAEAASGNSRTMATGVHGQSAGTLGFICEGDEPLGSMEEVEAQTIGDLLPTDDDLISGLVDGFDFAGLSINQDDADKVQGMEHYTMRIGAGGGGAAATAQQLSWAEPLVPDRRSRFWQMDAPAAATGRIEVICPQPCRPARLPFLMEPVSRVPLSCIYVL